MILSFAQEAATEAAHGAAEGAHGAEHGGGFPPFDPANFASQLVWFALTFGALYFILSRFVLPSVQAVLDKRAAALKSDLEAAARQTADAEAARQAMEKASNDARAQARKHIEDARAAVMAEIAAEQAKADEQFARQAAVAETRISEARNAAMANVSSIADDLARDIVARLAPGVRA